MKTIIRNSGFALLLFAGLMSACSSDENIANQEQLVDFGDEVTFTITTEKYESANSATRATWNAIKPTMVDMGNGLVAEMSIEEDVEPETRAVDMSEGHYTIYAMDAAGVNRIPGANKKLTGKMQGGVFIKDPGSRLQLASGTTYTFVCISDGVTDNGTSLSFTSGTKNPMIGKTVKALTNTDRKIKFEMKHLAARVRFKIAAYTETTDNISFNITSVAAHQITNKYDLTGNLITSESGSIVPIPYTMPATLTEMDKTYVKAHRWLTDYLYVRPSMLVNELQLSFNGGELYKGIDMTGNKVRNATFQALDRNKSYTISLKPRPHVIYLFNDGTNGTLAEKGSRIPVGILTREKMKNRPGTAAALSVSPTSWLWEDLVAAGVADGPRNKVASEELIVQGPPRSGTMMETNGYELTWDKTSTVDDKKRADESTQYPAFHWAAHYSVSSITPASGIGKWYIPALGEMTGYWDDENYGLYNQFLDSPSFGVGYGKWGYKVAYPGGNDARFSLGSTGGHIDKLFSAFTDAGGLLPADIFLWTASTANNSALGQNMPIAIKFVTTILPSGPVGATAEADAMPKNTASIYVLPFVHF